MLFKFWTCVVHLTLLCLVSKRVTAVLAPTTIQATIHKAVGTLFNGVASIEWGGQSSDASEVAAAAPIAMPPTSSQRSVATECARISAALVVENSARVFLLRARSHC